MEVNVKLFIKLLITFKTYSSNVIDAFTTCLLVTL